MNKVKVKIVIGSNYGDECKGLATHYFSQCRDSGTRCLNVLFNGGSQRGHTVELKNGYRHIFHHFGSGTLSNADTYFDQNFILNPIVFVNEFEELYSKGFNPHCFVSPMCRISTPYDAFINQIVELSRGRYRHGSCGCGIWETTQRYLFYSKKPMYFKDYIMMTDAEIYDSLHEIAHSYLPRVLLTYGIKKIPLGYKELIDSDGLIEHFIQDVRTMQAITKLYNFEKLKNKYDYIIFEGAQGLELDENNIIAYPHVTASETTSRVPLQRIKNMNCDTEICYITRSYFTRHGAGAFPTECDKNVINPNIIDETNSYNDYQQIIRYGLFNKNEFKNRIIKDMSNVNLLDDVKFSVFISHLNYTNGDLAGDCTIKDISSLFSKIYLSDTKFAEDVKEVFPL